MRYLTKSVLTPLAVVMSLLISSESLAAYKGEMRCFVLPVTVDREEIPSDFHMCLNTHEFNKLATVVFSDADNDSPELVLKKIMGLLISGDVKGLMAFAGKEKEEMLKMQFKRYVGVLKHKKVEDMTLIRRYDAGQMRVFLLGLKEKPNLPVPILLRRTPSGYQWANGHMLHPIMQNIISSSREMARNPEQYKLKENFKYNNEILLPSGDEKDGHVFLRFNGYEVSYPMFSEKQSVTSYPTHLRRVLSFYEKSYAALVEADYEGYLSFFTKSTKEEISEWFAWLKSKKEFDAGMEYERGFRKAYYVMESDNLYVIFNETRFRHYHDMVLKNPDGTLTRVNYHRFSYFDSLLDLAGFKLEWRSEHEPIF